MAVKDTDKLIPMKHHFANRASDKVNKYSARLPSSSKAPDAQRTRVQIQYKTDVVSCPGYSSPLYYTTHS